MVLTWTEFNDSIPKFLADLAECIQQNRVEQQLLDDCSEESKKIIRCDKPEIKIAFDLTYFQLEPRLLLLVYCGTYCNVNDKQICQVRIGINVTHPDFTYLRHLKCVPTFLHACKGKFLSFLNESKNEDIFEGLRVDSYFATEIPLRNLLQIEKFERLVLRDIDNIRELLLCEQKLPINHLEIDFTPDDELPRMFFPEMMIALDGKPNESLFRHEYQRSLTFGIYDEFYIYLLPQVFVELITSGLAVKLPFLVKDLYDPRLLIQIWNFADHFDLIWRAASPLFEN